jgi:hypothetical protein
MLSVPTLWTVFVINFLALGLIWAYVMRSYPSSFNAARYWTGSGFVAAADHALYAAKKAGRNGFATYDPAPPLAPEPETPDMSEVTLRKRA